MLESEANQLYDIKNKASILDENKNHILNVNKQIEQIDELSESFWDQIYEKKLSKLEQNDFSEDEVDSNQSRLILHKITRFEGVSINKVYYSNSNMYGRLMITLSTNFRKPESPERLMIHRLREFLVVKKQ